MNDLLKQALNFPPGTISDNKTIVLPSTTLKGTNTVTYTGDSTVMTLQHAIQDLANDIANNEFSNFLAKTNPDIFGFLNNIAKINPSKFVDGNWGNQTNQALRAIYNFAHAIFNFLDDINQFVPNKLISNIYTKEYLSNLDTMIPEDNSLTPEQKKEIAPYLIKHIQAIHKMFDDLKNKIMQHRSFRQFIENNIVSHISAPQININNIKSEYPNGLTLPELPNIQISDLSNINSLNNWIKNNNLNISPQQIINQLRNKISNFPSPSDINQEITGK